MSGLKILKIGGSVITDKSEDAFEVLLPNKIDEICSAIAENPQNLILVHGAGSFGHPHVKRFGISNPLGVSKVHISCVKLSRMFCERLIEYGVPAVPVSPLTFFRVCDGKIEGDIKIIEKMIDFGLTPVFHGDVVLDGKFSVLSGDDIAIYLAEKFQAEALGFATDVDGVLLGGKLLERLDKEVFRKIEWNSAGVDVTGGMRAKVEKILSRVRCPTYIFKGNSDNISKFLRGEKVGTEIRIDRDLS